MVAQHVPYHLLFRDVANTAKHGLYRASGIPNLHAKMVPRFQPVLEEKLDTMDDEQGAMFILEHWQAADWQLSYHGSGGDAVSLDALKLFSDAKVGWDRLLREQGWRS